MANEMISLWDYESFLVIDTTAHCARHRTRHEVTYNVNVQNTCTVDLLCFTCERADFFEGETS